MIDIRAGWDWIQDRFGVGGTPLDRTIRRSHRMLDKMSSAGIVVPDDVIRSVMAAAAAQKAGAITPDIEGTFYTANIRLVRLRRGMRYDEEGEIEKPFDAALADADLMLKFASERGLEVSKEIVQPLLRARSTAAAGTMTDEVQAEFYAAYARLCRQFGDVTADTIRACRSEATRRTLRINRVVALALTFLIAIASVTVFVSDRLHDSIQANINAANESAVRLRTTLTQSDITLAITREDADHSRLRDVDPCIVLSQVPTDGGREFKAPNEIEPLQQFAGLVRDIRSQAIKLNYVVGLIEHDPFTICDPADADTGRTDCLREKPEAVARRFELNPAVRNYSAEVLCKIKTYQSVRSFATNVQSDYKAAVGALASFAFPILYALLGAYAFRLRLFVDTIRNRTYHPSFADSARMITAVIAGAIAGLFNPANGTALSPLATAFLVGYGVELFFRFLDTLLAAFGSSNRGQRPS